MTNNANNGLNGYGGPQTPTNTGGLINQNHNNGNNGTIAPPMLSDPSPSASTTSASSHFTTYNTPPTGLPIAIPTPTSTLPSPFSTDASGFNFAPPALPMQPLQTQNHQQPHQHQHQQQQQHQEHIEVLPAATKTERFLLTAADQEDGTRDERLARVIHAKYEAGMLKPFNYVKGYARLLRWMDRKLSIASHRVVGLFCRKCERKKGAHCFARPGELPITV